jgi:hypothetical protein
MIKFFSALFLLSLMAVGCSKQFIDLNPISNANEQNFYITQDDFQNAIYGAYSTLKNKGVYADYMQIVGDLRSDNTQMGTTASDRFSFQDLNQFSVQPTSPIIESIWNDNYVGIRNANTILDRIGSAAIPAAVKDRITGEARFLRGLFYFNLVRVFGRVPLVTQSIKTITEAYSSGRTDTTLIYSQVVADLKAAVIALPPTVTAAEMGRATSSAASALLGKVYLTRHDYTGARDELNKVITPKAYDILPVYADLWDATKKNSKESIFAVQFQSSITAATGATFTERYYPYQYPLFSFSTTSGGYNIPTTDIIAAYESGDLRKAASLKESYVNKSGVTVTGLQGRFEYKFHNEPVKSGGSNDNWPVLRYADVLLMYAEALNEIAFNPDENGEAFTMLNKIRNRANLPAKTATNANPALRVTSQDEFRLAIEQERRVEFAFEGHRWFDLVRTGRAIAVLGPKITGGLVAAQLVLPVPLSQIDVNPGKIDQNKGAK